MGLLMDSELVRMLMDMRDDISSTKTMVEELSGPDGRIKKLETDNTRQWWLAVAIAPVLALGHAIARKLGVQI